MLNFQFSRRNRLQIKRLPTFEPRVSTIRNIIRKGIKLIYPLRMKFSALTRAGMDIKENKDKTAPQVSIYSLSAINNKKEEISLKEFKGKKLMFVNLASECGYTSQYNELEELYRNHKEELVILGFPSNDFGGQEPGSDEEIATFCQVNFGVTFPLFHKSEVKGETRQPIYKWLSDHSLNGWNDQQPTWNFCKYLVDENGFLMNFFSASVSPISPEVIDVIKG